MFPMQRLCASSLEQLCVCKWVHVFPDSRQNYFPQQISVAIEGKVSDLAANAFLPDHQWLPYNRVQSLSF